MELGIFFGLRVLFFPRYLTHTSYVVQSKYVDSKVLGSSLSSNINLVRSCHGYCLTLHVHDEVCICW